MTKDAVNKKGFDLSELYSYKPEDIEIDISATKYSNIAYIQATPRDVYIDFLEMPGIKKENKVKVDGTRIYMSHTAAQKLAEVLGHLLEDLNKKGIIETVDKSPLPVKITKEKKSKKKTGRKKK